MAATDIASTAPAAAPHQQQQQQQASSPAARATPCYADASYWDQRYTNQPLDFEWFYGWQALRRLVRGQLPKRRALLQVGCGNSNLQERMATSGFQPISNVDISSVVVSQMRAKHAGVEGLEYVEGDCRDMQALFPACHFWGAFDKGTVDALLCSQEGALDATRMLAEVLRVLRPGSTFLLVSLGEPRHRLPLLCQPGLDWDSVKVLLLRRVPQEQLVQVPGRPLPVNDTQDPISPLGPFPVNLTTYCAEGLPSPWDASQYFFAYACRKKPLVLQVSSKLPGQLPESWRTAARKTVEKLQVELGLPKDLFDRGIRRRRMRMSDFMALQQQPQQQQQQQPQPQPQQQQPPPQQQQQQQQQQPQQQQPQQQQQHQQQQAQQQQPPHQQQEQPHQQQQQQQPQQQQQQQQPQQQQPQPLTQQQQQAQQQEQQPQQQQHHHHQERDVEGQGREQGLGAAGAAEPPPASVPMPAWGQPLCLGEAGGALPLSPAALRSRGADEAGLQELPPAAEELQPNPPPQQQQQQQEEEQGQDHHSEGQQRCHLEDGHHHHRSQGHSSSSSSSSSSEGHGQLGAGSLKAEQLGDPDPDRGTGAGGRAQGALLARAGSESPLL